jgi:opacity protein-like surface antigen
MPRTIINIASIVFVLTLVAAAQESRSEIGVQGIGLFTQNSNGYSVARSATETGGILASYRYHINRWLSAETAYGYGRSTQKFSTNYGAYGQQANLNQVTGGIVASLPAVAKWKLSPYLLAEGGTLIFNPTGSAYGPAKTGAQSQNRGAFAYGAGLNLALAKHISLRTEYRGLLYDAPNFQISTLGRGTLTHTAQPSVGIVFRF